MTNGKSGGIMTNWIAAVVAVLLLIGSGATAYSNINSRVLENTVRSERSVEDFRELDRYDVYLQGEVDELKGDAIRTEAEVGSLRRNTDKLEFTMGEILKEMKRMNENLIRMGAKNAST